MWWKNKYLTFNIMSDMALKILFDCGRMTMKTKTLKDTSKIKSYKRLNNMLRWRDIRSMRNWYSKEGRESSNDTRRCSNLVVYGFRQIWTFRKESLLYITLTVIIFKCVYQTVYCVNCKFRFLFLLFCYFKLRSI